MITKRKMPPAKEDSSTVCTTERKTITPQDYKKILQKRLYKIESESMPAT